MQSRKASNRAADEGIRQRHGQSAGASDRDGERNSREKKGSRGKKDIIEELDSIYDDSDMKIKIKDIRITDKEKMDKEDVKEFNEGIKDETGVNPHIKKVYQVEVKYKQRYKYTGDDWTDWDKKTDTLYVYKSNGNWYVFPSSIF